MNELPNEPTPDELPLDEPAPDRSRIPLLIAVAAIGALVVLVGGYLVYANFIREDAEPPLQFSNAGSTTVPSPEATDAPPTTGEDDEPAEGDEGDEGDDEPTTGDGVDGTWSVERNDVTVAGLRIEEEFIGGLDRHTAVGRSPGVDGSITIEGTTVTAGSFTVDLTELEFTDSPPGLNVANRRNALNDNGLEIRSFPEATFELTQPIELGEIPAEGTIISAEATGDLTLRDQTNEVTFMVDAQIIGGKLEVLSQEPVEIALADFDITAPVLGPVAGIADTGHFEFRIQFAKG